MLAAAVVWVKVQVRAAAVAKRVREKAGWAARASGSVVSASAQSAGQRHLTNAVRLVLSSSAPSADQQW